MLIRIVEGKDLPVGALRVRALMDGRQKATRTCTEGVPHWRQNLTFTFKNTTLEKLACEDITLNVTSIGKVRERVVAIFRVPVSAILHSENRSIISKWVALHLPMDGDDDDVRGENCGFLKISACIYGNTDGPLHMNDDLHCDEIWSGVQLEDHTLRIRLFRLHHLVEEYCQTFEGNIKKKEIQLIIRVRIFRKSV